MFKKITIFYLYIFTFGYASNTDQLIEAEQKKRSVIQKIEEALFQSIYKENQEVRFEQETIRILNSVYSLFENKTFKLMSENDKRKFQIEIVKIQNPLTELLILEKYMKDAYIDAFDQTVDLLSRLNSNLAQYMKPLCLLARVNGNKQIYTIPKCVQDGAREAVKELTFVEVSGKSLDETLFDQSRIKVFFQNMIQILNMKKLVIKNLSAYFAYCFTTRQRGFNQGYIDYATNLLNGLILHKSDGSLFSDQVARNNEAGFIFYDQILFYKQKKQIKPESEVNYITLLSNFRTLIGHKILTINPKTKSLFLWNGDETELMLEVIGNDISRFPNLEGIAEKDPRKRIEKLCRVFNQLNTEGLILLAQDIASFQHGHIVLESKVRSEYNIAHPTIFDQITYLWKKVYDHKNDYQYKALVHLCFYSLKKENCLFFNQKSFDINFIFNQLIDCIENDKSKTSINDACFILKIIKRETSLEYSEDISEIIANKTSVDNLEYPNIYRFYDAQYIFKDELFADLPYFERLLNPVLNDKKYCIEAGKMLYEVSLRANNLEKALHYADVLHRSTQEDEKIKWHNLIQDLKGKLTPSSPKKEGSFSDEEKQAHEVARLEQEKREEEERRVWIQRQLELKKEERLATKNHEEQNGFNIGFDEIKKNLQFNLIKHSDLDEDLNQEVFRTSPALKQNYTRVLDSLKIGDRPADNSKFIGKNVTFNGKQYALWHCRLNEEHRVFYFKVDLNVYIIQAFGHDLNEKRLS